MRASSELPNKPTPPVSVEIHHSGDLNSAQKAGLKSTVAKTWVEMNRMGYKKAYYKLNFIQDEQEKVFSVGFKDSAGFAPYPEHHPLTVALSAEFKRLEGKEVAPDFSTYRDILIQKFMQPDPDWDDIRRGVDKLEKLRFAKPDKNVDMDDGFSP